MAKSPRSGMTRYTYALIPAFLFLNSCGAQITTEKALSTAVTVTQKQQPRKGNTIIQDGKGRIWFTCDNNQGLRVYDPVSGSYTQYTMSDGLSCASVTTLLEDHTGKIWAGTADGITVIDDGKISTIPITTITGRSEYQKTTYDDYGIPFPLENSVTSLLQDSKGVIWIGTFTGVYQFDGKNYSRFRLQDGPAAYSGASVHTEKMTWVESIFEDRSGNIWYGGRGIKGVYKFDGRELKNLTPQGDDWLFPIYEDQQGTLWFSARCSCLYQFEGNTFTKFKSEYFTDFFFSMTQDDQGRYWFDNSSKGPVTVYDGTSFSFPGDRENHPEHIGYIFKDNIGKLWFRIKDNLLCVYDGKEFTTIKG